MEDPNYYIKGFNNGYILKKQHPKLLDKLLNAIKSDSEYKQGLTDGGKQFQQEHIQQQIQRQQQQNSQKRKNSR